MSKTSLVSHIKKQALGWTIAGIILTVTLSISLSFVLIFKDAESNLSSTAQAVVSSSRTELFEGDARALELRLRRQFSIGDGEKLLFLDSEKRPWVGGSQISFQFCDVNGKICKDYIHNSVSIDFPIYFDEEKATLWGYFHLEKHPKFNWPLISSVILAVVLGMLFQALGFYFNIIKSIKAVGLTMTSWAQKLSGNPKDISHYESTPFAEIEPIENALSGLKNEIDLLEGLAREQGALSTLRGIGHDILNPVARMKRIIGLLQMKGSIGPEGTDLIQNLNSNLKRLSNYAEQLKLLYKYETGEISKTKYPSIDLSQELKNLARDLSFDPEAQDKNIQIESEVAENCTIQIPHPILGRIVENIVGNSIQASGENTVIRLKANLENELVQVIVEDSGSGIPEDIRNKIFMPDFTTKSSKGTGLGLFVVKQLCENYGGQVSLESEIGKGTKFKISFPRAMGAM